MSSNYETQRYMESRGYRDTYHTALLLGSGDDTSFVRSLIKRNKLSAVKRGGQWWINESLQELMGGYNE
jgi:hypothetical protein